MSKTQPVPRKLLAIQWLSLGTVALFFVTTFILGATRQDYDPWQQAVSALSLGPEGWMQNVCFMVAGVAVIASVPAWIRIMAYGRGGRAYPILIASLGLCFIAIAFVPQDPAPGYDPDQLRLNKPTAAGLMHLTLAFIASASSIACLFLMASRFKRDPNWHGWRTYSIFMGVLTIACVIVYAAWSVESSGYAGAFERMAMILPMVWTASFVYRLWTSVPFMIVRPADQ